MLISFLSFGGGIERREGLGLYYHTVEGGTGPWKEKGVMKGEERGVWAVYNPYTSGGRRCIQGDVER